MIAGDAQGAAPAPLLGLTCAEFCARARAALGFSDRFHRPLYRQLMHEGVIDPDAIRVWAEASAAARSRAAAALPSPALPELERARPGADGAASAAGAPAGDATARKLLLRLADGAAIECVLIPMRGGAHHTLCVSSQVGCRMGCTFCHTASMGLVRQLRADEIVAQVVAARVSTGIAARNIVFMGMGEPLDNAEAVAQAVRVLTDRAGLGIAPRHLTISTVGRLEGLSRWRALGLGSVHLAVSLGCALPQVREALMPIACASPLGALQAALAALPLPPGRRILVSAIVIPGVTDTAEAIAALVDWLAPLPALVNLIPYNPIPARAWRAPTAAEVIAVRDALDAVGISVRLRTTRGRASMAACGQLATPRPLRALWRAPG